MSRIDKHAYPLIADTHHGPVRGGLMLRRANNDVQPSKEKEESWNAVAWRTYLPWWSLIRTTHRSTSTNT